MRLLEQAGRTVAAGGIRALSLRRLAVQAGTSTTAIYALFGGKPGLLGALFEESFTSFGAAQLDAPVTGDSLSDLAALAAAYWTWARGHPDLYSVMFGQVVADLHPTAEQAAAAATTIEPLVGLVRSAIASGLLAGDEWTIAFAIWSAVHGAVTLVMAGCGPPDEAAAAELFQITARAAVRGWLTRPA